MKCPDCGSVTGQTFTRNLNLVDWHKCDSCGQSYGVYEEGRPEGRIPGTINKFSIQIDTDDTYGLAMKVSSLVNAHGAFTEGRAPLEDETTAFQLDVSGTWWMKFYPDHGPMLVSRWGIPEELVPVLKGLSQWRHAGFTDNSVGKKVTSVRVPLTMPIQEPGNLTEKLRRSHRSWMVGTMVHRGTLHVESERSPKELTRHCAGVCQIIHEEGVCIVETPPVSTKLAGHIHYGTVWALRGKPQVNMGFEHVWGQNQ